MAPHGLGDNIACLNDGRKWLRRRTIEQIVQGGRATEDRQTQHRQDENCTSGAVGDRNFVIIIPVGRSRTIMLLCVRLGTLLRQRGQEGRKLPTERGWRLLATQPRKIAALSTSSSARYRLVTADLLSWSRCCGAGKRMRQWRRRCDTMIWPLMEIDGTAGRPIGLTHQSC